VEILVSYRLFLLLATLLPMGLYYLLLAFVPQNLATSVVMGIPSSIFWGVAVMFWGVLMALVYVIMYQKQKGQP
jgi:uncharacterized membrane protein (DUF485 family)